MNQSDQQTAQSVRVAFKELPVESQAIVLRQLLEEHAYYAGFAGLEPFYPTDPMVMLNEAQGQRDAALVKASEWKLEFENAFGHAEMAARERDDAHIRIVELEMLLAQQVSLRS